MSAGKKDEAAVPVQKKATGAPTGPAAKAAAAKDAAKAVKETKSVAEAVESGASGPEIVKAVEAEIAEHGIKATDLTGEKPVDVSVPPKKAVAKAPRKPAVKAAAKPEPQVEDVASEPQAIEIEKPPKAVKVAADRVFTPRPTSWRRFDQFAEAEWFDPRDDDNVVAAWEAHDRDGWFVAEIRQLRVGNDRGRKLEWAVRGTSVWSEAPELIAMGWNATVDGAVRKADTAARQALNARLKAERRAEREEVKQAA